MECIDIISVSPGQVAASYSIYVVFIGGLWWNGGEHSNSWGKLGDIIQHH